MKPRILFASAALLTLAFVSCSKIENFRFKTPDQPGDSTSTASDTSKVIRSLTITRYDAGNALIDSSTKYFFYDTIFGVIAVSTTPITDTVQPFTGYIYLHEDKYGDLTRVFGRYKTNPDSIRFLKMTYNYDADGILQSAVRMGKDNNETTLDLNTNTYGNGLSYMNYPDDIPATPQNYTYSVSRLADGFVSSVYTHNDDWSFQASDTIMIDGKTGEQSPIERYTYPGAGNHTFANITEVNQQNPQLRNFHRALFLGIEFLPGNFFGDELSPEIAREFQPWLPVTTDVTLENPDYSLYTTTFHHNPVIDGLGRLKSADFYSIVDNKLCKQHWVLKYK